MSNVESHTINGPLGDGTHKKVSNEILQIEPINIKNRQKLDAEFRLGFLTYIENTFHEYKTHQQRLTSIEIHLHKL